MSLKMEMLMPPVSVMNAGMKCTVPLEESCYHTGYIRLTF